MSLGGVFAGAEALQGPVHAGGPHEATHRREATQMHSKDLVFRVNTVITGWLLD